MTDKNIPFPHVSQAFDSSTCGPSCIRNVFEHYELPAFLPNILQDLGVTDKEFTFVPQLARYLNTKKFETLILNSCSHDFSPDWKDKSKEEVINFLKRWVTTNAGDLWIKDALHLLFYMMEGGKVNQVDLSTKLLDKYLSQQYLILVCVDDAWIWERRKIPNVVEYDSIRGRSSGHFVLIYNQDGNDYLVSDPYPTSILGKDGLYRVKKDKMLVAILGLAQQALALKYEK